MPIKSFVLLALSLASLTCVRSSSCPEPGRAENNRCPCAYELELDTPVNGTTVDADIDQWSEIGCGTSADLPGVWFKIDGTGDRLKTMVCTYTGTRTVYSLSTRCNTDERCIGGPDDSTFAQCSNNEVNTFEFDTEVGTPYYINVRGAVLVRSEFEIAVEKVNKDTDSGGDGDDGSAAQSVIHRSVVSVAALVVGASTMLSLI